MPENDEIDNIHVENNAVNQEDSLAKIKEFLFRNIPEDGSAIGNITLRTQLKNANFDDAKYWEARNELVDEGKIQTGRGQGGSVSRLTEIKLPEIKPVSEDESNRIREQDLYEPILEVLKNSWVQAENIGDFVIEVTANNRKRALTGKWTIPDIVLYTVNVYKYIPGKISELITFEIKRENMVPTIDCVFETASHSTFANRSYLVIPSSWMRITEVWQRIQQECENFKIGLITFSDPNDWDTYETPIDAVYKATDPDITTNFIEARLSETSKNKILKFIR